MAAVHELGDEQRECVMLRFIQGFSVSETAAVMGKNNGAIRRFNTAPSESSPSSSGEDLR